MISLQVELGASPVSALGIVSDSVVGAETEPLRNWPILFKLFAQFALDVECFLGRLYREREED